MHRKAPNLVIRQGKIVMYSKNILEKLNSNDKDKIVEAIREVKINKELRPSEEIISSMRKFIYDSDEDIQHEAIFALGLHWGEKIIYSDLIQILESKETVIQINLELIINSIGFIVKNHKEHKNNALKVLSKLVIDDNLDPELRGTAYGTILYVLDLISSFDKARLPDDIKKIKVDWILIERLLVES